MTLSIEDRDIPVPPAEVSIRWCPVCGRDDRTRPFTGKRHARFGVWCTGVPVKLSYTIRGTITVPLAKAIEIGARLAMKEGCPFTGVSGDFDACSSTTRQVYEERSAKAFGVTLDDYYAMEDDAEDA